MPVNYCELSSGGMRLSEFTLKTLRSRVEEEGGFQLAIAPISPWMFERVRLCADGLHEQLEAAGYSVLLDDRNQKPKNMFKVLEFLKVEHRFAVSNRSIDAGVYEYRNLRTDRHKKVEQVEILLFLAKVFV